MVTLGMWSKRGDKYPRANKSAEKKRILHGGEDITTHGYFLCVPMGLLSITVI